MTPSLVLLIAAALVKGAPELPRVRVDTTYPARAGRTITVGGSDDFQAALEAARPGDDIVLEAGAVFTGPFTLPRKDGKAWIVVRSSAKDRLPPPGTRVTPADASAMPKLEARWGAVIDAEPASHHYRFVGIEVRPSHGVFLMNVVLLGSSESTLGELPHHLIFDRCYIHGDPALGSRRGIALGSRETAVVDSWISDIKEKGADSQAIAGWNGLGPFRIENNTLEGAGENVMFGGADPKVQGLVPSDIEILRNHFRKPLAWKSNEPGFEGTRWSTKNLFELKNARRVVVAGNLFEQNWVNSQSGFAILLTVRNQDGKAPWSVVEDVTFENNVVRHTAAGIDVLGRDDSAPSGRTARIAIRNNLFEDVGGERWGGGGRLFQILEGAVDVVITHNTAFQTGSIVTAEGEPDPGFVYRDNITPHNAYGIVGTGVASGLATSAAFFPDGVLRRNVIVGGSAERYPTDNFFPPTLDAVGFVDRARGDYRLGPSSPYRHAGSDGTDVGADFVALREALDARPESAVGALGGSSPSGPGVPGAGAVLWACLLVLAYANVGYPVLLLIWGKLKPRPFRTGPGEPSVTLVIAAHNEAGAIEARLENLLALDYPIERLEILLGLDGCNDATADRARAHEAKRLRVIEFEARRGKAAVVNALVAEARGEIVVLGDARQRYDAGAVRALVAPFADPEVGAVTGELILTEGDGKPLERGLGLYWRCEKAIRHCESQVGSVVGVTGAIYAIRRELFEALPPDTILDDVLVPMRIARRGLSRRLRAAGSSLRPCSGVAGGGVRPQGADHRRKLPAVRPRTLASGLQESAVVADHLPQGIAPPDARAPRVRLRGQPAASEPPLVSAAAPGAGDVLRGGDLRPRVAAGQDTRLGRAVRRLHAGLRNHRRVPQLSDRASGYDLVQGKWLVTATRDGNARGPGASGRDRRDRGHRGVEAEGHGSTTREPSGRVRIL